MLDNLNSQMAVEQAQPSGTPGGGLDADSAMLAGAQSLTGEAAGQPQGMPQQGQEPQETPLTRAEVAALLEQKLNEYKTRQDSAQQKAEARIKKEFAAQIEALKRAGVELNPEQTKRLQEETRQRISDEERGVSAAPSVGQPEGSGQQPPADVPQNVQMVNAMAMEIAQEYGFGLDQADPEVKMVDMSSPAKYLRSLDKALASKQERLKQKQQVREEKPGARAPMMGGGSTPANPIANNFDLDALYSMATKRR